jgi:hypothetical protein
LAAAALVTTACSGSENLVFEPFVLPVAGSDVPTAPVDAGDDSPPVEPKDAGGRDAGPPAVQGSDPWLDPSVTFNWVQTLPGRGTCKEGVYVGSFQCTLDGLPPLPIAGQIVFTLDGSTEDQLLSITEGKFADLTGALFQAKLAGSLDCLRRSFSAMTQEGTDFLSLPFDADLWASFDDQELVFTGEFHMTNAQGDTCTGSWSASAQP